MPDASAPLYDNPLLTVEDVAELLRYRPETIRQMARDRRLPGRKVGKSWRFERLRIERWLQGGEPGPRNDVGPADGGRQPALPLYDAEPRRANGAAFKDPAFTENRGEPVHRWVPWIAGFGAGFVADCLAEYLPGKEPSSALVLDPFAGVGTTLVEAHRRGYGSAGFEINPWAALAARAKLEATDISVDALEEWTRMFAIYMREFSGAEPDESVAPPGFRSRVPFFSPAVRKQVLRALRFIDLTGDAKLRDLLLVAFGSVMVRFSNYTYEPSLASRPGSGKPLIENADVAAAVVGKLREMCADCRHFQATSIAGACPGEIYHDSIFNARRHLARESVDLAITSPPYLNNYHYVRNTRPHLFWLRFIRTTTDLKQIEHESFGKFWQTVRAGERIRLRFQSPCLEKILAGLARTNTERGVYGGQGWANYAAQYFNDMDRFCEVMTDLLKPGGRMVVVIGNSILQGHDIRVDRRLSEIAARHGLETEANHLLRSKRVGNSIIRSSVRNAAGETASLYEASVVLRRSRLARSAG